MVGVVRDPDFNDASKWDTSGIVSGSGLVAGGKFTGTGWGGTVVPIAQEDAVAGNFYYFEIVVDSFQFNISGLPVAQIVFGGKALWSGQAGAGTFTGVIQATSNLGLSFSSLLLFGVGDSDIVISRILIMADHVRKQIRDAIVTTLTGLVTTGTKVFSSRVYPIQAATLPCLAILTNTETIALEEGTLDAPHRLLTVEVRGIEKATSALDDTLDEISKEIEIAMGADITLGGLSISLDLSSTEMDLTSEGDQPHGQASLFYIIQYRTPFGDPSTVA